jgi:hypothetical protein
VTRRLFLVLIMWFAADFAVPFEPGPGRFVMEDMEEALASPRSSVRAGEAYEAPAPPSTRVLLRADVQPRTPRVASDIARREWRMPPPIRAVVLSDRPAPPEAH